MARSVTLRDWVELAKPTLKTDALNFFSDAMKQEGRFLVVASDASFSGYLLNGRTYPGVHMQQGVPTWCDKDHGGTAPYCAPVLLNHDSEKDPIGRVAKAQYTRLWTGRDWFDDWKKPVTGFEKGSGVTRLWMSISDKDAQEKFLDGRYKTFSTSFRSPFIGCSICMTDLTKDACDHQVGKDYEIEDSEVRRCYLVTGPQFNKEVSNVNHPAQPWAVAETPKWTDDLKAALCDKQVSEEELGKKWIIESPLYKPAESFYALCDSEGNVTPLSLTKGEQDVIPLRGKGGVQLPTKVQVPDLSSLKDQADEGQAPASEALDEEGAALGHILSGMFKHGLLRNDGDLKDLCVVRGATIAYISGLTAETDGHQHSVYLTIDLAAKTIRGWTESCFATKKSAECEQHSHPISFDVEDLNADVFTGMTRDASCGPNHIHDLEVSIARDAHTVPSFEECMDLVSRFDRQFSDSATLTPSQRKIVNTSAFCGPGRTFPVPDLLHVDAVRRLVPRFNGSPSQKTEILEAVGKRAKALACTNRDAGNNNGNGVPPVMSTPTTPSPAGTPVAPAATPPIVDSKDKTISLLTDQLKASDDRSKGFQSDLDSTKTDLTATQKKLTDAESALHTERCERLALLRAISGTKTPGYDLAASDGLSKYATELQKRGVDSIKDSIADEMGVVSEKLPGLKGLGGFMKDKEPSRTGDIRRSSEEIETPKPTAPPQKKTGKSALLG